MFLTLAFAVAGSFCTTTAAAAPRVALVIGNSRYEPAAGALRNAGRDARAMARALRALEFSVVEKRDVTRDQLLRALGDFRAMLSGAEIGIFYYAGHGISVNGSNYLIPVKSGYSAEGADDVALRLAAETRLFNVEQAAADMATAGAHCNLIILDACRNTPLGRSGRTRDIAVRSGLAEMNPPAGTLVAFSADAGQTALDGEGENGLYTEELLKHLRTAGLTIEQVFKRTRAGVLERSGGAQIPAEYSRLVGADVYLAGTAPAPVVAESGGNAADEVRVVKAEAVLPPSAAQIMRMATQGKAAECVAALRSIARVRGPGEYSAAPFAALLEGVKDDLKDAAPASPKALAAVTTCELVLGSLADCLPASDARTAFFSARAHSRRGDACMLLGRTEEALQCFDAAVPLAPEDAYIRYNRGRALLALGRREEARAEFLAASNPKGNQPGARKLAATALQGLD